MELDKFNGFKAKLFYVDAIQCVKGGNEEEIIGKLNEMKELFYLESFEFTKDFEELNLTDMLLELFSPNYSENIRQIAFECLKILINKPNIGNDIIFQIIDKIAPSAANFEISGLMYVHIILSECMKNSDCQQHLFACPNLYFDQIASLVTQEYGSADEIDNAFLFVGSTFNFATSDFYAKKICAAVNMIGDSEFKSYLIFKISCTMPHMVEVLGFEVVVASIYSQLESEEIQQNERALLCLNNIIKETKNISEFNFEPVFAKLECEADSIVSLAAYTLTTLASLSTESSVYLIENGIFQRAIEEISGEGSTKRKIEYIKMIAVILANVETGRLTDIINMDIINILCEYIEIDDPAVCAPIMNAFYTVLSVNNPELTEDTMQALEENNAWESINEYTSHEDSNVSLIALKLVSEFHTELPPDE